MFKMRPVNRAGNLIRGDIRSGCPSSWQQLRLQFQPNFYCMFMMNEMEIIRFHSRNGFAYISITVYCSDPCLYAKRTGGHHLSANIKHNTVALIRTEI